MPDIPSPPKKPSTEYDCSQPGKKFEKTLDDHTKMGRVTWSSRFKSCIAETTNVESGTEMYSVTAIPSGKNIGVSGGVTSTLNQERKREDERRAALWDNAVR